MRKLWGGHYDEPTDVLIERLNNSLRFDARLWRHDIQGSIAHATMLGTVGIIAVSEAEQLVACLKALDADLESGVVELDEVLARCGQCGEPVPSEHGAPGCLVRALDEVHGNL